MRVSVIIPVYNEKKTIIKVLKNLAEQDFADKLIVVDDGSTDTTSTLLKKYKENYKKSKPTLTLIRHEQNKGKGAAVRTGIKRASGNYLVIQDADSEYNPSEYNKLLANAGPKRVVYGSRIKGGNPHAYLHTYLGNVAITSLFNILYGKSLTDTYTCYKVIPTKIAKSMNLKSDGFEIEAEITAKLANKGIEIIELPISFSPRSYGKGKKIKAKDAVLGALTFLKYRFNL